MFLLCFNLNRIHDSVGRALRTADQGHVTYNSYHLFGIISFQKLGCSCLKFRSKQQHISQERCSYFYLSLGFCRGSSVEGPMSRVRVKSRG
jgi:hypothetical protein